VLVLGVTFGYDYFGYPEVIGQVQNVSNRSYDHGKVSVDWLDAAGNRLADSWGYVSITDGWAPGEIATFDEDTYRKNLPIVGFRLSFEGSPSNDYGTISLSHRGP
jgi:hypothetical protein